MVEAQWAAERRGLSRLRTEQPPYSIFVRHIEHDVLPVAQRPGWVSWCGVHYAAAG
jgi:aryl-alcohol dehydrogenase (NADP+)